MDASWFAAISLVRYEGRWVLMYRWAGGATVGEPPTVGLGQTLREKIPQRLADL